MLFLHEAQHGGAGQGGGKVQDPTGISRDNDRIVDLMSRPALFVLPHPLLTHPFAQGSAHSPSPVSLLLLKGEIAGA